MAKKPPGPGGQRNGCAVLLPDALGKLVAPGLTPVLGSMDPRSTDTEVDCQAPPSMTCGPCSRPRPAGFQ
jgi:hypothetical protein